MRSSDNNDDTKTYEAWSKLEFLWESHQNIMTIDLLVYQVRASSSEGGAKVHWSLGGYSANISCKNNQHSRTKIKISKRDPLH
jgi:hypothetical protein